MTLSGVPELDVEHLIAEANRLRALGQYAEAEQVVRSALQEDPGHPDALATLADLATKARRTDFAVRLARRALGQKGLAVYHQTLANALAGGGNLDGAIAEMRRALAREPSAGVHAALIFLLDLHHTTTPEAALAERQRFDRLYCARFTADAPAHPNRPDPARRLRVGYVGADFRAHSAASAWGPVVRHHDPEHFEVYLYSTNSGPERHCEDEFSTAYAWREIGGLAPDRQAAAIREDRIDVLVDLGTYSAGAALEAFARRPAPVQVTGWGYATGTGLGCLDYLFADPVATPPWAEAYHTETIWRLPVLMAYTPGETPEVAPGPSDRGGARTFGWLGRPNYVTPPTLDAWARVLAALPEARMLLKSGMYVDPVATARVVDGLVARGVEDRRIDVLGETPRYDHLASHAAVDVVLDTFPQGGGATVLDALWMGVPVVTLAGRRLIDRKAASFLTVLGRADWIAETVDQYVQVATRLRPSLDSRQALRAAMAGSILVDGPGYARAVEDAYRAMWRRWCAQRQASEEAA